jgi:prepilin-type N-terminal cleavage/methylation domain-containing protein
MRRDGYTLIEMLVVLVIMGLAAGLVAPMLLRPTTYDRQRQLTAVVQAARTTAATRGEVIYVRIEPTGEWHMEGGGLAVEGDVARGRMDRLSTAPLTLIVSPIGSCSFDVRSTAAAAAIVKLDPLICELRLISSS